MAPRLSEPPATWAKREPQQRKSLRPRHRKVVSDLSSLISQFDPQAGHRPAVVPSPASHNGLVGMIVCCPTTTRIKSYPFEVALASTPASVVLVDQVKSQNWRAGKATRKDQVTAAELAEMWAKLWALIG